MSSLFTKCIDNNLIQAPRWIKTNLMYEVITGSYAYGVSSDMSDTDVYGVCIPPKEDIFPHLKGVIVGFGEPCQRFGNLQRHHVKDKDREYDFDIYNIVKYFDLCMNNNPNIIDSLFVSQRCILHMTPIGGIMRDRRKEFLNKKSWHTFKSYAHQQLHKTDIKNSKIKDLHEFENEHNIPHNLDISNLTPYHQFKDNNDEIIDSSIMCTYFEKFAKLFPLSKREQDVREKGWSTKFLYHVVRLLNECEQILLTGDIDLEQNREQLKAIRRGDMTYNDVLEYFNSKEKELEKLYLESKLPYGPDENNIKSILLDCLEHHYGNLSSVIERPNITRNILNDLQTILDKYR